VVPYHGEIWKVRAEDGVDLLFPHHRRGFVVGQVAEVDHHVGVLARDQLEHRTRAGADSLVAEQRNFEACLCRDRLGIGDWWNVREDMGIWRRLDAGRLSM
jgi:hypothetical protein